MRAVGRRRAGTRRQLAELAPGGRLVIIDPDVNQKWGRLTEGCRSDPQETRQLAERAGLRLEKIHQRTVQDLDFYVLTLSKPILCPFQQRLRAQA